MSRPRRLTPEERRERKRLRSIEYRKRNREKIRAYKRRPEVKERHKAECRKWRHEHQDYQREYYASHQDAFREYNRRYADKHRAEIRARQRACSKKRQLSAEQMRNYSREAYVRRCLREMVDCDFYARNRAKDRARKYAMWRRMGLNWGLGRPAMRIPDWCVRGGVLDTRSKWLVNNLTDSQRAYARELAIQRKEQRERMAR